MLSFPSLSVSDFDYSLPEEKIARYPLVNRDEAKLLVYKESQISQQTFYQLPDLLPEKSLLVFNNAKVIPARIFFKKPTGSIIEVFCLEPIDIKTIHQQTNCVLWKCFIGNNKRWKESFLSKTIEIGNDTFEIKVVRKEQVDDAWVVEFSWENTKYSFFEILDYLGNIPLPPYLKREAEEADKQSYQTIYAKTQGSVASPTAGLHFTERVFDELRKKDITTSFVTLHVGAGTFKPVVAETIANHYMHTERIEISKNIIIELLSAADNAIIPVGTTSVRVLESLYWHGVKLLVDKDKATEMHIAQWDAYTEKYNCGIPVKEALQAVLYNMETNGQEILYGQTQLMIVPGYRFRVIDALITNFHQPKSTLLLLIAAMVGEKWKDIYSYALANDFRFLSYGDCCLIYPSSSSQKNI